MVTLFAAGSKSSTKKLTHLGTCEGLSRAVLVGGTRNNFTFHSLAENAGNSFHHFQSDLTVNFLGGWTGIMQDLY